MHWLAYNTKPWYTVQSSWDRITEFNKFLTILSAVLWRSMGRGVLVRVNFHGYNTVVALFPLFGFFYSVVCSVLFNFEGAVSTHCQVGDLLPSISSAIGDYSPRYVWRICIALHTAPRFLTATANYAWNRRQVLDPYNKASSHQDTLSLVAVILTFIENGALVLLTYISSRENLFLHQVGFIVFIISSILYMLITCLIHSCIVKITRKEKISFRQKKLLCFFNILTFTISMAFYFMHASYCIPYSYTAFSLCEYFVVLTNIMFHYSAVHDLHDCSIVFGRNKTTMA